MTVLDQLAMSSIAERQDSAVAIRVAVAAAAADPLLAPTIGDDVIPNVGKP